MWDTVGTVSLSAYVHFPWCLQKCPYCDFASASARRDQVPHAAYADAVCRELDWRAPALAEAKLASVFFGGGTPSLWEASALARVLGRVRAAFARQSEPLEVTVECNPSSLDEAKASALREAGVTRLSIGVQSLDDTQLRFLGRLHDAERALGAVRIARAAVGEVNADLMFGMPGLAPSAAAEHACRLVEAGATHVSVYALTVEPATQFGQLHAKGKLTLAPDETFAACYMKVEHALAARGFEHYEVSNYAPAGHECTHNLHTWKGGAYLGLGAGAVGCLRALPGHARRYRNDAEPARYVERSAGPQVEVFEEALDAETIVREHLMLGLRTADGVDLDVARAHAGIDPLASRDRAIARALALGNLVREANHLRVPRERWLHLDGIVAELF